MRKRIVIMIIALALALSGCQLAKPDAEAQKEKDIELQNELMVQLNTLMQVRNFFSKELNRIIL